MNEPQKKMIKLYFDFEKMESLLEKMVDSMAEEGEKDAVMGFTISFDNNNNPLIQKFDSSSKEKRPELNQCLYEPLSTLDETEREFFITLGFNAAIESRNLKIDLNEKNLIVTVISEELKYSKKFPFEKPVEPKSLKMNLNNGILEMKVEKKL
ncbi:MAG: Hsp20/alpha crystallin family protein [Candidatus Diapherotrites archaeon]